jgi:hypothetical protein
VFDDTSAAASALCDEEGCSAVKCATCEKVKSRLEDESMTQEQ